MLHILRGHGVQFSIDTRSCSIRIQRKESDKTYTVLQINNVPQEVVESFSRKWIQTHGDRLDMIEINLGVATVQCLPLKEGD